MRIVTVIVVAAVASAIVIVAAYTGSTTPRTSANPKTACSLLTEADMEYLAWNGAGREIPGLNQSAPPWSYQSIYDHVKEGWQNLCQTTAFVSAIQAHGTSGFSFGGGFINPSDPDNSQMGVAVIWSQTTSSSCTQYIENWSIFIVNGSATGPTTSTSDCIS